MSESLEKIIDDVSVQMKKAITHLEVEISKDHLSYGNYLLLFYVFNYFPDSVLYLFIGSHILTPIS